MKEINSNSNLVNLNYPDLPFVKAPFRMALDVNKISEKDWFELGDDNERSKQMIE